MADNEYLNRRRRNKARLLAARLHELSDADLALTLAQLNDATALGMYEELRVRFQASKS